MRIVASTALALLAVSTTQAAEWVSLGTTPDGNYEVLVDRTSVRFAGPFRRAWFKNVYPPQSRRGSGSDANKWTSETVTRSAFNCDQETVRLEALTVYYEDGTNFSVDKDGSGLWEPVRPETVAETMMRFICSLPAPKPKPKPLAARTAEWVSVESPDGGRAQTFVDKTSLQFAGPIRRASVRREFAPQSERGAGNKWLAFYVSRLAFNCDDGTFRAEAGTHYFEDGTNGIGPSYDWTPSFPGSVAGYMQEFVCSLPAPKTKPETRRAPKQEPQPKEQTTAPAPMKI